MLQESKKCMKITIRINVWLGILRMHYKKIKQAWSNLLEVELQKVDLREVKLQKAEIVKKKPRQL